MRFRDKLVAIVEQACFNKLCSMKKSNMQANKYDSRIAAIGRYARVTKLARVRLLGSTPCYYTL